MKIELRRITYSAALSQETSAFTADIWIDGELAFRARDQGHGAGDLYQQVGRWSEREVDAWLRSNRPARVAGALVLDHDLEPEVGDLLARELEYRRVKRLLRTNLVTIERDQVFQYLLRKRPLAVLVRAVIATNPAAIVVNDADDTFARRAVAILVGGG